MSRKTEHYTPRQKDALFCEASCKRQAKLVEKHWRKSAPYFAKMLREQLYSELDHASFSEWATSIGVSPSHAYSLAQIATLPDDVKESLEGVGLANIKIILPKLEEAVSNRGEGEERDNSEVEELVDEATRMRWSDLRESIHGDSSPMKPVPIECPHCKYILELSRAARIESWYAPKRGKHG